LGDCGVGKGSAAPVPEREVERVTTVLVDVGFAALLVAWELGITELVGCCAGSRKKIEGQE
jgi:hypothetical protein